MESAVDKPFFSKINAALIVVSLLGAIDAFYLTLVHIKDTSAICNVFEGCDVVLQSMYAEVFGIPLALIGLLYYLALFFAVLVWMSKKDTLAMKALLGISGAGVIFGLWLLYLQASVLNAFCQYCIVSLILTLVFFGLVVFEYRRSTYVVTEII